MARKATRLLGRYQKIEALLRRRLHPIVKSSVRRLLWVEPQQSGTNPEDSWERAGHRVLQADPHLDLPRRALMRIAAGYS